MARILIIGSGGREHALAWKLSQSPLVKSVLVSPGNGGTDNNIVENEMSEHAKKYQKVTNVIDVPSDNYESLSLWCKLNEISLVVVGPEVPLADGICDVLAKNGVRCFGPTSSAAALEASKEYAKEFMVRNGIPTAQFKSFKDADSAIAHINTANYDALVVKASGLAAGKGVVVCETATEACKAVKDIFEQNLFGSSGDTLVVEERLYGEEFSLLCFTDGDTIAVMPPIQDHKQVYDGDKGPNTGGMGAYGPCPQIDHKVVEYITNHVLQVAVDGMKNEGKKYVGVLYAGIMLTKDGAKVLEFNCRFGDPECQVLMSLLDSDLYEIFTQCCKGSLNSSHICWKNTKSVCIVLASSGYPGAYEKGKVITGIGAGNQNPNLKVFEAGTKLDSDGNKITSGGRVLSVCSTASNLEDATRIALAGAEVIKFEGSFYRKDIGWKGLEYIKNQPKLTYASCGVSVSNGDAFVHGISSIASSTARKGCTAVLGGFGALFDLAAAGYSNPVLVSGTDGVGTKLLLAQGSGRHSTIGQDLVAMCVNDVLTHNAEPLFFLDYLSCGKLKSKIATEVVHGISEACKLAGCGLIGGETAEMPGMYANGEYDLAGFAVGAYDKKLHTPLPRLNEISEGDVIVGISSNGLHSNGFSLVREVVKISGCNLSESAPFDNNCNLLDCLLAPTAIYTSLLPVLRSGNFVKALAHITGGGINGNLARVIPNGMCAIICAKQWEIQPVFGWLSKVGDIDSQEMLKTFNCGLGMCMVIAKEGVNAVMENCRVRLASSKLNAYVIGYIEKSDVENKVIVNDFAEALKNSWNPNVTEVDNALNLPSIGNSEKPSVAVFISGTGTNMQALINHENTASSSYTISLIISNKANAGGLKKASAANIPYIVLDHKNFPTREAYDLAVHEVLMKKRVHFICLAGFMRLLSGWFTRTWRGRIINIHPSLLPSFKGMDAHKQVLKSGVRITGCTVHYVTENMDEGAIIAQTAVPVEIDDDVTSLSERVKTAEHQTYPKALDLVASGQVQFNDRSNKVTWLNK
uniref:trifunctional purine biosynthetic protein adenosine-3-like n=1 Tax=Styela clava TaxID=7725 RepID=UPI00193A067B|nr:trifunctional purine biosynthetic protein adenosine-3-like [Styela clava]